MTVFVSFTFCAPPRFKKAGNATPLLLLSSPPYFLPMPSPLSTKTYTLSHLENDRDVSACYGIRRFLLRRLLRNVCFHTRLQRNLGIDAQRMRFTAFILRRTEWHHGRSRDETKYTLHGMTRYYYQSLAGTDYWPLPMLWMNTKKLIKLILTTRLLLQYFILQNFDIYFFIKFFSLISLLLISNKIWQHLFNIVISMWIKSCD